MAQDHRARQYASTHQRIYDAAMGLFAEHGYEDVSIARVRSVCEPFAFAVVSHANV